MDRRILWAGAGVFVLAFLVLRKKAEAALLPEIPGGRLGSARVGPQPGTIEGDTLIFEQNLARELEKKGPEILAAAGIESLPDDYTWMDLVKGGLPGQGPAEADLSMDTTSTTSDMSLAELGLTALDVVATGLLNAIENVTAYIDPSETVPGFFNNLNTYVSEQIDQAKGSIAAAAAAEAAAAAAAAAPDLAGLAGFEASDIAGLAESMGGGNGDSAAGGLGAMGGAPGTGII